MLYNIYYKVGDNVYYDLTKQEDIEAINKDMKFEENGISINDMLENVKKQKICDINFYFLFFNTTLLFGNG